MKKIQYQVIEDFPEYEVNDYGYIRNRKTLHTLKNMITTDGYYKVDLFNNHKRKTVRVHRIVCKAFLDNPDNKREVNHKDGNKLNNHLGNLEWVTPSENLKHAYDMGLLKLEKCYKKTRKPVEITQDNISLQFSSSSDAANYLNVDRCSVSNAARKHSTIKGWTAKYITKGMIIND